jgi:hypothetical protein
MNILDFILVMVEYHRGDILISIFSISGYVDIIFLAVSISKPIICDFIVGRILFLSVLIL